MFDFHKLEVYKKARALHKSVQKFLKANPRIDRDTRSQLRRASMSICLNLAEGSGRWTKKDKRNFCVNARGSAFECVSVFDLLLDEELLSEEDYQKYYQAYDQVSRMLWGMMKKLDED